MSFAEATKAFLATASELDPGVEPSPELMGDYGRRVASHFGVEDLHDLEVTSAILGGSKIVDSVTPTELIVCTLLIGFIAGSTATT